MIFFLFGMEVVLASVEKKSASDFHSFQIVILLALPFTLIGELKNYRKLLVMCEPQVFRLQAGLTFQFFEI